MPPSVENAQDPSPPRLFRFANVMLPPRRRQFCETILILPLQSRHDFDTFLTRWPRKRRICDRILTRFARRRCERVAKVVLPRYLRSFRNRFGPQFCRKRDVPLAKVIRPAQRRLSSFVITSVPAPWHLLSARHLPSPSRPSLGDLPPTSVRTKPAIRATNVA